MAPGNIRYSAFGGKRKPQPRYFPTAGPCRAVSHIWRHMVIVEAELDAICELSLNRALDFASFFISYVSRFVHEPELAIADAKVLGADLPHDLCGILSATRLDATLGIGGTGRADSVGRSVQMLPKKSYIALLRPQ